jgi:cephalosporin hydroxylase
MKPKNRARILQSPLLPILTFPYRMMLILRHLWNFTKLSVRWLLRSKEFANFTYDLTEQNKAYLAHFVANISGISVNDANLYMREIEDNVQVRDYVWARLKSHRRGNEIDDRAFYGRRVGWYVLIRAHKPQIVVETGTEKGLGSLVIAEALRKNGKGKLVTIDMEPSSGLLIGPEYSGTIERMIGDSLECLLAIDTIDFFIHDSDHSAEHELAELNAVLPRLSADAIVLSDNSHVTNELQKWALLNERRFAYFAENPLNHWYNGAGIGVSYN